MRNSGFERVRGVLATLAGLTLVVTPAAAVNLQLTDQDIQSAIREGWAQAQDPAHGYQVEQYVLFGISDPLKISASADLVDAVIVATPRERLLYQAYLNAFEGEPLTLAEAGPLAAKLDGTVAFRVFAHSQTIKPSDRDFLKDFGQARLRIDGKDYPARSADVFGPGEDFFILDSGEHVLRWLGSVTFSFDASSLPATSGPMTLAFTDGRGKTYKYDLDLEDFR